MIFCISNLWKTFLILFRFKILCSTKKYLVIIAEFCFVFVLYLKNKKQYYFNVELRSPPSKAIRSYLTTRWNKLFGSVLVHGSTVPSIAPYYLFHYWLNNQMTSGGFNNRAIKWRENKNAKYLKVIKKKKNFWMIHDSFSNFLLNHKIFVRVGVNKLLYFCEIGNFSHNTFFLIFTVSVYNSVQ